MKTLKEVKCGETVTVAKLGGEGALKRRIMDMGITKGTPVYVRKVAPLGDPGGDHHPRIRALHPQERGGKHPRRIDGGTGGGAAFFRRMG